MYWITCNACLHVDPSEVWLVTGLLVSQLGFGETKRNRRSISWFRFFRQLHWLLMAARHYPKITINIDSVTYPPLQSASSKAVWAVIHCIIRLKKALMQLDLTCESDGLTWCKNHGFTILASRSYRCSVGVGCFGPFFGGGPARSTRASSRSSTKANLTKLTRAASKASNYISTAPVSKECVRWSPKLA